MVTLNKILFPTDFSEASEAALDTATRLARASNARLMIVHVLEPVAQSPGPIAPPVGMSATYVPETNEEAADHAREELEKVVPEDTDIPVEHHLLIGVPDKEITKYAEEVKPDLIVMGTHGRTGLKRLLMGSVAEGVVRRATCPVLTLRQSAEAFSAEEDEKTEGDARQTSAAPADR